MPTTPRLIVYQQTYHVNVTNGGVTTEQYVSMKPLVENNSGVTHVILSAFHLNDGGNLTLNDHTPDNSRFTQLWEEATWLKGRGVKVMAMLGGAGVGSYQRLTYGFDFNYNIVRNMIAQYGLQGIDLDVEEWTDITTIITLINRLRRDFGNDFIISLAPVYAAMLPRKRAFAGLTTRILNATTLPRADPVTEALCKAKSVHSNRNLSGFSYVDLEARIGSLINFYNVQMYNNWGDPSAPAAYQAMVQAGWKPEKLVMGVLTCPHNGSGHQELGVLSPVIRTLMGIYGGKFGGVMGWEYFNADAHQGKLPWEWVRDIGRALGKV